MPAMSGQVRREGTLKGGYILQKEKGDLKLIITSATLDAASFVSRVHTGGSMYMLHRLLML